MKAKRISDSRSAVSANPRSSPADVHESMCQRGKLRGLRRMKEFGYKRVTVWFDKSELEIVTSACNRREKKLATFIRESAVANAADSIRLVNDREGGAS